jgi:hypothetical protein
MNAGRTVFAQLIAHLSHLEFQKCVTRYDGDQHHRSLSCWDQYLVSCLRENLTSSSYGEGLETGEEAQHRASPLPDNCSSSGSKQHLRIKAFFGTCENAVKTQIWIAVSVYVLVAIVRKRMSLDSSLYQILQILSLTLFEKTPILQALQASDSQEEFLDPGNQLILFDF